MTDTDTREMHEFLNRVRALHNLDRSDVQDLTEAQWELFLEDPTLVLMQADDATAAVIWRAMHARLFEPDTLDAKQPCAMTFRNPPAVCARCGATEDGECGDIEARDRKRP